MRWLAATVFLVITLGCAYLALAAFVQPNWVLTVAWGADTSNVVVIGAGIFFLLLGACSVVGGLWVWRNWPDRAT
jgi:hypothetical protein